MTFSNMPKQVDTPSMHYIVNYVQQNQLEDREIDTCIFTLNISKVHIDGNKAITIKYEIILKLIYKRTHVYC